MTDKAPILTPELAKVILAEFTTKFEPCEGGLPVLNALRNIATGRHVVMEREEVEALRANDVRRMSQLGVGDGSGSLFVYGNYESIKAAQAFIDAAIAKATP